MTNQTLYVPYMNYSSANIRARRVSDGDIGNTKVYKQKFKEQQHRGRHYDDRSNLPWFLVLRSRRSLNRNFRSLPSIRGGGRGLCAWLTFEMRARRSSVIGRPNRWRRHRRGIRSSFMAKWLDWHYRSTHFGAAVEELSVKAHSQSKHSIIRQCGGVVSVFPRVLWMFGAPRISFAVLSFGRGPSSVWEKKVEAPPHTPCLCVENERSANDDASRISNAFSEHGRSCWGPARLWIGTNVPCSRFTGGYPWPGRSKARYFRNSSTNHEHYGPKFGWSSSEVCKSF